MITVPDTTEIATTHVVSASPDISGGNTREINAAVALLQNETAKNLTTEPKLVISPPKIMKSPLIWLAQQEHARISSNAAAAIRYSANPRTGFAAQALSAHLATQAENQIRETLSNNQAPATAEKTKVAVLSPQNMTIEGLAHLQPQDIELALFLICPDVFGKFDPENVVINEKIVHLFWNSEAYETARVTLPRKNVKLIVPIDPLAAFPEKPSRPLAKGGTSVIKLSGTGGHENTIKALATQLTALGLAPTVVCEMASKLDVYGKNDVATESDPGWYYHSLGEAQPKLPPLLICHPSEQVKHLIVLQKKGIFVPTIFLYPKGLHEVKNLAWAIKHGLSRVVCVPKTLPNLKDPRAEVARQLAAQGVNATMYRFVDPSEITAADFEKPTKTWEQPPNALSLFDAIRSSLNGTSVTVQG